MAREYAKLKTAIWGDDDYRALPVDAQWLYQYLFSSPKIDICGVTDWDPRKISAKSCDLTVERVRTAGHLLCVREFIVVDDETGEVLVRTFIKHDGSMRGPKTAKGVMNAWADVSSDLIRTVLAHEIVKIRDANPTWSGCSEVTDKVAEKASRYPVDTLSTRYQEVSEEYQADTSRYPVDTPSETETNRSDIANGQWPTTTQENVGRDCVTPDARPGEDPALIPLDRPDVTELCEHLHRRITANGSKPPTVGKTWHDAARRLLDIDHRDPDEAHRLIDWSQDDEFWQSNILSMPKFRSQYDKLRLQAERRNLPATSRPGDIDWDAALRRAQDRTSA